MNSTTHPTETRLDRIGIPYSIRWGFLGVLVFMTGNGVDSNIISPHLSAVLGSSGAELVATILTMYSLAALIASYLSGALADLFGPRRVMLWGFLIWAVFEALFLLAMNSGSVAFIFITYFLRGFGFPFFAFAFLVWINAVVPIERNGTAVGWFYVMFTGGFPTLGSLYAAGVIPLFGSGTTAEALTMWTSIGLVTLGFLIVWFGVRDPAGYGRLAPKDESSGQVIFSGLRLTFRNPRVLMGFLVRLINTAPEFGMFVIMPAVIAQNLGWGQSRWLLMTTIVYASNILLNAVFGAIGDRWGWVRTVRWFGVVGSALGLLAWWYVPHWVPAGSDWGYVVSVLAGVCFGVLLAGFVPLGAILPALTPDHKGAAMAMYTTAAGGATFLGTAVVAIVQPWGGNVGVVWAFVALYACSFVMTWWLEVNQTAEGQQATADRQR
ncbi:RbtT/DalT/CsbX family MFS transporter [Salinisphaera sp.]|uniref:RbtT/DalT/CsbX family MFS transporter n=1 Tax=Salinisphaera sp. TaxID=1914330 RepID=UPI002D79C56C|nr:RbtT/DalT/CsbX family MFS transporter [Salinisphaera sp.]HET7315227.1 RbtT/DalT/CsbX family MFS transporter [Salinisphaera sp.]